MQRREVVKDTKETSKSIASFAGEYSFLSNFYPVPIDLTVKTTHQ